MLVLGKYEMIRSYIDKVTSLDINIYIKLAVFAAVTAAALWLTEGLLFGSIQLPEYSAGIIFAGAIIMLVAYDFIFTLAIRIYRERIKRVKSPEFKLGDDDE